MKKGTKLLSFLALALLCSTTWFGATGCDFTPVNEGKNTELETLLADVSKARTKADAEKGIQKLLNKTGVGSNYRPTTEPGPYDGFTFGKAQMEALATAQANHNGGTTQDRHSARAVYEDLMTAHEEARRIAQQAVIGFSPEIPNVTFEEVVRSLEIMVRQAVETPEEPENALLLTIVARGGEIPKRAEDVALLRETDVLSPVQRLLFAAWFHRYATTLPLYVEEETDASGKIETGSNHSCPPSTPLCAQFKFSTSKYVFENPIGNLGLMTVNGNKASGTWSSLLPIDRVVIKGKKGSSTLTDVILVNGATTGSFSNKNLKKYGQYYDIYEVQFCLRPTLTKKEWCKLVCFAKFIACKLGCGSNCQVQFESCVNGCHDQGG